MKRTSLLVALLVVLGMVAIPAVGALEQQTESEEPDDTVSPGERLSGVVGVQSAEIDGEIERSAFATALDRADDNATKASHIAEKHNETEQRLAALEERKAELQEQRESGEITEGQYRAKTAKMATEIDNVERQLNQSDAAAAELPAETLEENGVNVTAIQTLKNNASELSGGEVSEIARSIAGDRSGMPDRAGGERADDRSSDRATGNGTDADHDGADDEREDADDEQTSDHEQSDEADADDDDDSESQDGTDRGGSDRSSGASDANQ